MNDYEIKEHTFSRCRSHSVMVSGCRSSNSPILPDFFRTLKASNRNCLSASRENGWKDEVVSDRPTNAFNSAIFASLWGSLTGTLASLLRSLLGSITLAFSAATCKAFSSCCNNVTTVSYHERCCGILQHKNAEEWHIVILLLILSWNNIGWSK